MINERNIDVLGERDGMGEDLAVEIPKSQRSLGQKYDGW
jgi:hypothetical protein